LNPSDIGSTIEKSYWNENNGGADNGVGIALTIDEFRDENSFDGFDFTSEWKIFQGATFPYLSNFDYSEYPGFVLSTGSGTSVDPFEINTPPQLSAIQINLDAHYKLTSNIDLSTATSDGGIFWFDGKGWDPIGNSSTPFVGSLDGNGYTISNIFINREGQLGVGLFGRINAGGEITRLAFENADITGGSNTGIITGYLNDATIEEIWVSGEVSGSSNVGGIVGNNIGGDISSSYSSADVSGAGSIGGAVGYHNNSGTLSTSYSTGTATGDTNTGALVGRNLATITDSYWNSTTGSPDNGEGTALTSIEMREETSFTGFDFTTNWQIIEAAAFPTLINNEQTPAPGFAFDNGDGSSGDPYEISNPEQLNAVRAFPDEYFELVSDIDLTEATGSSEGILWNDGKGFDPISNAVGTSSFSGSFDGNEHTISGLYINRPSENNASLLGYIYNGVVKNLGMKDVNITGGNISTAGVAGRVISADEGFSNIYVIGTVTGTDYVGGVFGLFSSGSLEETVEVSNLYSTATVTGNEDVGGAVAYTATGMQFTNSYAAGVVTGTTNVGGLTGRINSDNGATVTNSFWNSDSTSVDNGLGSALNTTQMRQGSNFTGFDFTNDWRIANGNSFPYLRNAVPNPLPGYIEPESLVSGKSVAFSDGRIEAPNNSVYDDLEALTVELWFKINSSKLNGLVEKWSANTGFWLRVNANNRLEFNVQPSDASGSKIASSADEIVDLDTWYHLSAWYDGTDSRLYLNGEHVTDNVSSTNSGTLNNNNRTIGIGDLNWISGALDGAVDEVRIWKTARTEEEIRQNMFQQLNGDEEGLIAYYPFDETEGEIALDKTANENHGFLDSGISQSEDTHPYGTFITGNEGWHMMSSPFGDASYGSLLDTLWTQGFPGSDTPDNGASNVYFWDESAREFTSITNATVIPAQGTGFITFVYDDSDYDSTPDGFPKEIRLDSTQSSGVISPALSFTDSGTLANDGWNFVGNPYGATIDWDITNGWTQTNLDTSIYVWNNADSTYQTWNGEVGSLGDGLIAPWQGFWVKANAADPSITFTDEARSAGGILRKEVPVPELRLTISDGRATNSAIVMLYEQADVQKDKLDAYKLASLNDDYLSLFTQHEDGTAFDINALPTELEKPISIDIDFSRGGSLSTQTDFELSWNTESLPEDWQFTLRDNVTGEEIDLREPSAISLQLSASKAKQKETDQLHLVHQVMKPKVMKAKSDTNPRFTLTITSSQAVSNEPIIDLPTTVELQQN
ncbi:MAG: LamG-like jellyroll fold domain-containing protein, partial [Balneolaceae bacterium]